MEQFVSWLARHNPALAGQVIGSLVVDQHHLTEPELLAKAQDFYVKATPLIVEPPRADRIHIRKGRN
jgi:hypothetical protein